MSLVKFKKTAEFAVVASIVLLANRGVWLCLTDLSDPLSFCEYSNIGGEILVHSFVSLLAAWLLIGTSKGRELSQKWRRNPALILFLLLSLISLAWSVYFTATVYRLLLLLFSSFLGSFLGIHFTTERLGKILFGFSVFIILGSWLLLIFFPNAAIMGDPHAGSWRGIIWHKNLTGSLLSFAAIMFLYTLLAEPAQSLFMKVVTILGFVLSLIFVVFSKSAAGLVILAGLSSVSILFFVWSKIRHRLRKKHYLILGGVTLILVILGLWQLDFLFSLLNRESSLTGRLPLWTYLIAQAANRPILGHGFGAIWVLRDFRAQVTAAQGWSFTITNGHNGYIDILLGLGSLGFLLVILISTIAIYRAGRLFIMTGRMEYSLPLLIALYFLLANLSISFILELEVFHWILLIAVLFGAASDPHQNKPPATAAS